MTADDDEEAMEPREAYPPLYLLAAPCRCPECNTVSFAYALCCTAFRDADWDEPAEDVFILNRIAAVPEVLEALLAGKCPRLFLDTEEAGTRPYLMNHCQCGAQLIDDLLHGDVGAPFWPCDPDGFKHIKPFQLPLRRPIMLECSWALGGGEYLELDKAERW